MSKKDEAFELFSQGKDKNDPEVLALGLAKRSNRKYYRLWKEGQTPQIEAEKVVKVPVPQGVSISSLRIGAQFELAGRRYRKLAVQGGKILCLHLTGGVGGVQKAFKASTRVIAK